MKSIIIILVAMAFSFLFEKITGIDVFHSFSEMTIGKIIQGLLYFGVAYIVAFGLVSGFLKLKKQGDNQ